MWVYKYTLFSAPNLFNCWTMDRSFLTFSQASSFVTHLHLKQQSEPKGKCYVPIFFKLHKSVWMWHCSLSQFGKNSPQGK